MTRGGGTGNGVAGGPARHIPVLARPALEFLRGSRRRHLYRRDIRGGRPQPPHAGGCRCSRDRHRPRSGCGRAAEPHCEAAGRLTLVRRPLLDARSGRACGLGWTRSTACCSTSAFRRCSSMRRSAAFRSGSTGRSTCGWAAKGPSAADVVAHAAERDLAAIIAILGEERHARAVARAIVRARREAPITTTRRARRHRVARRALASRATSTPRRARSRRCASSSTTNWANWPRACRRRAHPQAGGPAGRHHVPFARGPHRQDLPGRARDAAPGLAPHARGSRRLHRASVCSHAGRS